MPDPDNTQLDPVTQAEDAAKKEIESLEDTPAPKGISEKAIEEKVSAGLTRDQAIEVIKAQADYNASNAPAKKKG